MNNKCLVSDPYSENQLNCSKFREWQ